MNRREELAKLFRDAGYTVALAGSLSALVLPWLDQQIANAVHTHGKELAAAIREGEKL